MDGWSRLGTDLIQHSEANMLETYSTFLGLSALG
jgi:hypothetical protein